MSDENQTLTTNTADTLKKLGDAAKEYVKANSPAEAVPESINMINAHIEATLELTKTHLSSAKSDIKIPLDQVEEIAKTLATTQDIKSAALVTSASVIGIADLKDPFPKVEAVRKAATQFVKDDAILAPGFNDIFTQNLPEALRQAPKPKEVELTASTADGVNKVDEVLKRMVSDKKITATNEDIEKITKEALEHLHKGSDGFRIPVDKVGDIATAVAAATIAKQAQDKPKLSAGEVLASSILGLAPTEQKDKFGEAVKDSIAAAHGDVDAAVIKGLVDKSQVVKSRSVAMNSTAKNVGMGAVLAIPGIVALVSAIKGKKHTIDANGEDQVQKPNGFLTTLKIAVVAVSAMAVGAAFKIHAKGESVNIGSTVKEMGAIAGGIKTWADRVKPGQNNGQSQGPARG